MKKSGGKGAEKYSGTRCPLPEAFGVGGKENRGEVNYFLDIGFCIC